MSKQSKTGHQENMLSPNLPPHWKRRKQRYAYRAVRSGNWGEDPQGEGRDIACLRISDFDRDRLRVKRQERAVRSMRYGQPQDYVLSVPSLLLERSGGAQGVPVGKVVLYDQDERAGISNFIVALEPAPANDEKYLLFQHRDLYLTGRVRRAASHTHGIQNLDIGAYLDEDVPWPPYKEQQAIGQELDEKHQQLHTLHTLRMHQKSLLQERYDARMQRLLTGQRPQDENAPHAASEHWEKRLPPNWTLERLPALVEIDTGEAFAASTFQKSGMPVARLSDLHHETLNHDECAHIDASRVPANACAQKGDLLMALTSSVGQVSRVAAGPVAVNQRVARLRPKAGEDAFLTAFLQSAMFKAHAERLAAATGGMANLSLQALRRMVVPWPPPLLRARLGQQLYHEKVHFDALMRALDCAGALHQERFGCVIHRRIHGIAQS